MSGGGGSSQTYYANQDKLLGAQADIATGVYNSVYQPYAPKTVAKLSDMVDDAQNGTLTARARATAGADADASMGAGLGAATRATERFGATINPNSMAHDVQTAGIQGAALRSGAMNNAQQWGEGQKWGRTSDFYNSLQGVPTQSASTLGSAANSYGMAGSTSQANDNSAAAGMAKLGVSMTGTQKLKDGGEVQPKGLRLAAGGAVPYLPKVNVNGLQPSHGGQGLSAMDAAANFAMPIAAHAIGAEVVRPALKSGLEAAKSAWKDATTSAPNALEGYQAAEFTPTVADPASMMPELNVASADGASAAEAAAAADAAAATEAAMAAEAAMTAEEAAAIAAIMLRDGGTVPKKGLRRRIIEHGNIPRKDIKKGGHITGPGTSTSDSVPLMGSAGEFMLNAEAVKIAGKKNLEALNKRGLAARRGA